MTYLEFARRNHGWSLLQLEQATRIHKSFISLIERGQGIPHADQLDCLSRALEIPADLLLKEVVPADLPREPEQAHA